MESTETSNKCIIIQPTPTQYCQLRGFQSLKIDLLLTYFLLFVQSKNYFSYKILIELGKIIITVSNFTDIRKQLFS